MSRLGTFTLFAVDDGRVHSPIASYFQLSFKSLDEESSLIFYSQVSPVSLLILKCIYLIFCFYAICFGIRYFDEL